MKRVTLSDQQVAQVRHAQSQYTRQPHEKVTLAEVQALLSAGIQQGTMPARVGARYAVIASGVSLILSIAALIVSVWRT